jgi:hypothetical protein
MKLKRKLRRLAPRRMRTRRASENELLIGLAAQCGVFCCAKKQILVFFL